jgi:hypothetical protein
MSSMRSEPVAPVSGPAVAGVSRPAQSVQRLKMSHFSCRRNIGQKCKLAPAALRSLVAASLSFAAAIPHARAQQIPGNSGWRDVNLAEYRQQLNVLDNVVTDCQAQIKLNQPAPANNNACDPDRVGPNDRVQIQGAADSQPREVRYDWLRAVLIRAGNKGSTGQSVVVGAASRAKSQQVNASDLLNQAHQRLQMDEQQAGGALAANPAYPNPAYIAERKSLDTILGQREYQGVTKVSLRDRFLEWLENLFDRILMRLAGMGARAPWAARLLEGLLLGGIGIVLIWFFIRIERSARVRLVPDVEPLPGSPSAREWQLWVKDAQAAAANGLWREAIHSVYWASIARLESGRLWPADRARTPREYLSLVGSNDPRKSTLTALTRSFEHTWYGGRDAAADDFNSAMALAAELGVEAK